MTHLLIVVYKKDMEEENFACCLLAFSLSDKFLFPVLRHSSTNIESTFFRIPGGNEDQQLSRNPPGLQLQTGTAVTSSLRD